MTSVRRIIFAACVLKGLKGSTVSNIAGHIKGGVTREKMKTERPIKDLWEYKRKWILANKILNMLRIAKGLPTVECPYEEGDSSGAVYPQNDPIENVDKEEEE